MIFNFQIFLFVLLIHKREPNDNIMELLIMCYACKTSCARNIICVIPYLPYSKQSKMKRRGCIVSKLVAKMLAKSGIIIIKYLFIHYFIFPNSSHPNKQSKNNYNYILGQRKNLLKMNERNMIFWGWMKWGGLFVCLSWDLFLFLEESKDFER